jgi:vacuolar-type H+-ATPase subunit D/Vma8
LEENKTTHSTQPQFFNQPTYQTGKEEAQGSDMYLKILIDENNQLKRDVRELTETLSKFRKGIGSKKRRILNELVSLIATKNSFDERYVEEVTKCPYRQGTMESMISNSKVN